MMMKADQIMDEESNVVPEPVEPKLNRHARRKQAVLDRRAKSPYWQRRMRSRIKMLFGIRDPKRRTGFCRVCDDGIHRGQRTKDLPEGHELRQAHETHVRVHHECLA